MSARTPAQLRTALKSRPATALQIFEEAALVREGSTLMVDFPNFDDRVWLIEHFKKRPALNAVLAFAAVDQAAHVAATIANKDFEVLGTNMTTALCTFDAEGGIKMTTATADNDQGILTPHLDTNMTPWAGWTWGTDQETKWGVVIKTHSVITTTLLQAKLALTSALDLATDADQVGFQYSTEGATSTTKWTCFTSIGGTDVEFATGVTVEASTRYDLRICIDSARCAHFFINGVEVYVSTALTNAIDLIPYVGVQALAGSAARAVTVRKMAISRKAA